MMDICIFIKKAYIEYIKDVLKIWIIEYVLQYKCQSDCPDYDDHNKQFGQYRMKLKVLFAYFITFLFDCP